GRISRAAAPLTGNESLDEYVDVTTGC
ncbi:hypothetical protein CDAR_461941, partial [Caerostris darwini]